MAGWSSRLRSVPFGSLALLLIAAGLFVALLVNATAPAGSGEERFSQAWAVFLLAVMLWIVLALLLVVGGVWGQMPRWAALSAVLLHPLAGVAVFVALDAASRNLAGALLVVALLPILIAGYALWARLPQLHDTYPPRAVSLAIWGAVALLTIGGIATGFN